MFRAELITSASKTIKADLCKNISGQLRPQDYVAQGVIDKSQLKELLDTAELSDQLKHEVIPQLVKEFDDFKIVPTSSRDL